MALRFTHINNDISDNTGGVPLLGGFATNNAYVDADKAKVDFITVTQAVDLDTMESRINSLDQAVVLRGSWDASAGTFPGGGTAQAGDSYIISTGGTVDGVVFNVNDRIISILDNASTTTFASNWIKADYTDQVLSVAGKTGAVTLVAADILSGTFADGRISQTSVTQHQAALTITESQISDLSHVVDFVSNVATSTILGRATGGTGNSEELSAAQVRTIINVEDGSTADQTDAEIATAYQNEVAFASQVEAETGTEATERRFSPLRIAQAIAELSTSGTMYSGTTTAISSTEIFIGGVATTRLTIAASSAVTYNVMVVGRDNTTGDCCAYQFRGLIKRDGANSTVMVDTEVKDILAEDNSAFDADVAADDTNEALIITVLPATANSTKWSATVEYTEVAF